MISNIIITIIILFVFYLFYLFFNFLSIISDKIIFKPISVSKVEHDNLLKHPYIIPEKIIATDDIIIDACLYNSYHLPSYEDIIFLYSHGNSGWIGSVIETTNIYYLSKYGSIFIYDYRGYGINKGSASSDNVFMDAKTVWKYLVNNKKISPHKIILYGHSLGTSISAYLMEYLLKNNIEWSQIMILQNPFYSIKRISNDIVPFFGNFIKSKFMTDEFIKNIDNLSKSAKIYIIHCKDDELIHYQHSVDLSKLIKNNYCKLLLIEGDHDKPRYDKYVDEYFAKFK